MINFFSSSSSFTLVGIFMLSGFAALQLATGMSTSAMSRMAINNRNANKHQEADAGSVTLVGGRIVKRDLPHVNENNAPTEAAKKFQLTIVLEKGEQANVKFQCVGMPAKETPYPMGIIRPVYNGSEQTPDGVHLDNGDFMDKFINKCTSNLYKIKVETFGHGTKPEADIVLDRVELLPGNVLYQILIDGDKGKIVKRDLNNAATEAAKKFQLTIVLEKGEQANVKFQCVGMPKKETPYPMGIIRPVYNESEQTPDGVHLDNGDFMNKFINKCTSNLFKIKVETFGHGTKPEATIVFDEVKLLPGNVLYQICID